jgi:hypothetical protein
MRYNKIAIKDNMPLNNVIFKKNIIFENNLLTFIDKLFHKTKFTKIEIYYSVEKNVEKIEDACRFTSRLLEHGDAVEILALRRIVGVQLMNLIKNTPKHNVTFSIEFQTDYNLFDKTVKVNL